MKAVMFALAGAMFAGCCCDKSLQCADPVIGNWSGTLPFEVMKATSMIFERGENGEPKAYVLHRWGSPGWASSVKISQKGFAFNFYNQRYEGEVVGDTLYCRCAPVDIKTKEIVGPWQPFIATRNPEVCPCVKTADAKFGEPIDILKDGLKGFELMNDSAQNGWIFKDGVLSNRVKKDAKGKKVGSWTNIMTKRNDFYDFKLDYDVRVPKGANSGVYLRGRFECQVVDSYGQPTDRHAMAAYYGRVAPSVAAEKPAGEWQHVTVTLYKRHLTVVLNGTTIIDNTPVVGVTGGAIDANMYAAGPIYIQGDHTDADYKNMILCPAY